MHRSRAIALLLIPTALAMSVAILLRGPSEPTYRGKSLSDWIITTGLNPRDKQEQIEVRRLATNSIPLLLEWLRRDDRPTFRGRIAHAKEGFIVFMESHRLRQPRPRSSFIDRKASYRAIAIRGLSALGPDAEPAIPELIQMLGTKSLSTNDVSPIAGAAYTVLPRIAPASIQPLINALSSTNLQVYALAAGALGEIGPSASAAIPVMREKLGDTNVMIRVGASEILGKLGAEPDIFMPALVESLGDPDFTFLDYKLQIVLRYKESAKEAIPALRNILTNTAKSGSPADAYVRDQVRIALQQIEGVPQSVSE